MSQNVQIGGVEATPAALGIGVAFSLLLLLAGTVGGGLRAVLVGSETAGRIVVAYGLVFAVLGATAATLALRFRLALPVTVVAVFTVVWLLGATDPEAVSVYAVLTPGVTAGAVVGGVVEYALRRLLVGTEGTFGVPAVDAGPVAVAVAAGLTHAVVAVVRGPELLVSWGSLGVVLSGTALFAVAAAPAFLAVRHGLVLPVLVAVPATPALTTTSTADGGIAAQYAAVASLALPVVLAVGAVEWFVRNAT